MLPVFISLNEQAKDPQNEDLNKSIHKCETSFIYLRKNDFKGSQTVLDYLTTDETLGYKVEIEHKLEEEKKPEPINVQVSTDAKRLAELESENKKLQSQIEILTK